MNTTNVYQRHPPPPGNEDEHQEKTSILKLPMDLTADIFHGLPGKSLVQCKSVCSSWRRYLLNPSFTKPLFPRTRCCLLLCGCIISRKNQCATVLIDLDKKDYSKPNVDFGLQLPTDPNLPTIGLEVVGSCNGLLCLVDCDRFAQRNRPNPCATYYISNPITGESFALPSIPFTKSTDKIIFAGFGFSPVSRVFKVLSTFSREDDQEEAMVLTIGSGSWRSIGRFSHRRDFTDCERKIYLNGFLYWIVGWNPSTVSICSFDVEREVFQLLPSFTVAVGADNPYLCACKLGVLRGCLSLVIKTYMRSWVYGEDIISIWVMKINSIKESWTKQYEIRSSGLPAALQNLNGVVEFTEEGQILKLHKNQLLVYNCERGLVRVEGDGIPSIVSGVCVHIPSFVPLRDIIRGI